MSTRINVSVDRGGLLQRNRQQTTANRQAALDAQQQLRLQADADEKRAQRLAAEGRAPDGTLLAKPRPRPRLVLDEPAANRVSEREWLSMGWVVVSANNWYANIANAFGGYARALQRTYSGSNTGRSIYISSIDGTSWLSVVNSSTLRAPAGFTPGETTSMGASGDETYRIDQGINDYVFDVFPVGRKGSYVLTFRFQRAYVKARWDFTGGTPEYTVGLNQKSALQTTYRSFLVSTSAVKEVATPQAVADYFTGKFPGYVPSTRSLRRYSTGIVVEARTTPDPSKTLVADFGSVDTYDLLQGQTPRTSIAPYYWWLNGWYQKAMPTINYDLNTRFALGAPAIFSRAANTATDFSNYFSTYDANGVVTVNSSSYNSWFMASYLQDQRKLKRPVAFYISSLSAQLTAPMAVELPVYRAISASPSGYGWFTGVSPRVPASDTSFWQPIKTLTFDAAAVAMPSVSGVQSSDSDGGGQPQYHFCVATDWGAGSYCRRNMAALGFTTADLTP